MVLYIYIGNRCLSKNIIYNATVEVEDKQFDYIGLCSTDFKARLGVHKQSFKNSKINQTSLSKFIHSLKNDKKEYNVKWRVVDRGKTFSPISGVCQLCVKEAYHIIFNEKGKLINSSNEIFSSCRHRKGELLCGKNKKSNGN